MSELSERQARWSTSPHTLYANVSDAEAAEVGEAEAVLRDAIRTPYAKRTDEQRVLAKAWSARQREASRAWYAERGLTPLVIKL